MASTGMQDIAGALDMLERIVSEESDPVARIRRAIEGHLTVFDRHADVYSIFLSERLEG